MASLAQRYLGGDYEAVWNEIRRMGPVRLADRSDVYAVADETMRRVHGHVHRIVQGMGELNFVPASAGVAVHAEPTDEDERDLARLETEIGALPAGLRSCMAIVGGVRLLGDCPPVGLSYHQRLLVPAEAARVYPDPLCLPDASWLRYQWDERMKSHPAQEKPARDIDTSAPSAGPDYADTFWFVFAPDAVHKANLGGSVQVIALPQASADPVIDIGGHRAITLVEYLRSTVAWGGCPGWASSATAPPAALESLRTEPDF